MRERHGMDCQCDMCKKAHEIGDKLGESLGKIINLSVDDGKDQYKSHFTRLGELASEMFRVQETPAMQAKLKYEVIAEVLRLKERGVI